MKPAIATRNGQPAYLNAPLRTTQSMVNVQRTLTQRKSMAVDLKRLAAQVDRLNQTDTGCPDYDRAQPSFGKGVAIVVLAIAFGLLVFALGSMALS